MNPSRYIVANYIHTHFSNVEYVKGGREINASCTICGDSKKAPGRKKRFNYNLENHKWHCFNCGEKGRDFYSLIAQVEHIPYREARTRFKEEILDNIEDVFKEKKSEKISGIRKEFDLGKFLKQSCFKLSNIPKGMYNRNLKKEALNFLSKKRIDPGSYPFYVCFKGFWGRRLIIPIFENKKIVYFQGRSLNDKIHPKFRNMPQPKRNIILFEELFDPTKDIYLFEGFWEALILTKYLDFNATSVLGKHIKRDLITDLLKLTEKDIVICFDNDEAGKEAMQTVVNLSRVYFFNWTLLGKKKDLSDVWLSNPDREYMRKLLETGKMNQFKTQTLLKFYINRR